MSKFSNNNINAGWPIAIPAIKSVWEALALGTAAAGLSEAGKSDYQTEFLRNHGIADPREEAIREKISKQDNLRNTTYMPERHTSYIPQPTITPETEWYVPDPGTIYGGTIPTVIVNAPRAESRIGDAFGVLTGKKTVARDSTQTNQRDSTQTRRDSTMNKRPKPSSNEDNNTGKYFDWSKDMSWETPSESILKLIFKPRSGYAPWWRIGINWAPFGIGAHYLWRKMRGNKENNNSNTQDDAFDVNAMDDSFFE